MDSSDAAVSKVCEKCGGVGRIRDYRIPELSLDDVIHNIAEDIIESTPRPITDCGIVCPECHGAGRKSTRID